MRDRIVLKEFTTLKGKVVDLGCGQGKLLALLARKAKTVVGVDVDLQALKCAKHTKQELIRADITKLPLRDECADVIISLSVLEHILLLDVAVKEIRRILQKGGNLIIGYPLETSFTRALWKLFIPKSSFRRETKVNEEFIRNPHTHKQDYSLIRKVIHRQFSQLKKYKMLPLLFQAYEISRSEME